MGFYVGQHKQELDNKGGRVNKDQEPTRPATQHAELSNEAKYKEASEGVRHYSNCVVSIRVVTIVQGLAVVGATAYLTKDGLRAHALSAAVFGLFLTYVLYTFHRSYLTFFLAVLNYALALEKDVGPWTEYNKERGKKRQSVLYRMMHLYGAVTVMAVTLTALILFNAVCLILREGSKVPASTLSDFR